MAHPINEQAAPAQSRISFEDRPEVDAMHIGRVHPLVATLAESLTEGALDAQSGERIPRPEHERLARAYVAHRFPALAGAPLVGARVCQYELTPDTRFIVAPHPAHGGRVWIVGGGSGHAFKHGPALAERLEAWIEGSQAPEPRYALGTRRRDVALRTAG